MASKPVLQFYAELADYEPKIWRRFQVMNNVTMARLGYIIMTLFEMQASHLFRIEVPFGENIREEMRPKLSPEVYEKLFPPEEAAKVETYEVITEETDYFDDDMPSDAAACMVKRAVSRPGDRMTLAYDYGDGWEVEVVLEESFVDESLPGKALPRVLEGAGYGIIEDCGGVWGLAELARAFKKKRGPRYRELKEWLGRDTLDLESFDPDDMNFRLKKLPRIYSDCYELHLVPTQRSIDLIERRYPEPKI